MKHYAKSRGQIRDIYKTNMGHLQDKYETFIGQIWDIYGTFIEIPFSYYPLKNNSTQPHKKPIYLHFSLSTDNI